MIYRDFEQTKSGLVIHSATEHGDEFVSWKDDPGAVADLGRLPKLERVFFEMLAKRRLGGLLSYDEMRKLWGDDRIVEMNSLQRVASDVRSWLAESGLGRYVKLPPARKYDGGYRLVKRRNDEAAVQ